MNPMISLIGENSSCKIPISPIPKLFSISDLHTYENVYDDISYYIEIENFVTIKDVRLFINNVKTKSYYKDGKLIFEDPKIFNEIGGIVQLCIVLNFEKTEEVFYSDYLHVHTKDMVTLSSIEKMISYIYQNQKFLLYNGSLNNLKLLGLEKTNKTTIETQIELLKRIIQDYSDIYEYMKYNSKFKLVQVDTVDTFKKLKIMDNKSIEYIIQHPEVLNKSSVKTGIRYNNKDLIPSKILITKNTKSTNIYENVILLNFLYTICRSVETYICEIEKLQDKTAIKKKNNAEYKSSVQIICGLINSKLENYLISLKKCIAKIKVIFSAYQSIFPMKYSELNCIPKFTATFTSIKEYRSIYNDICQWFYLGVYNFENETSLIPFLANNQIYEYYLFIKLQKFLLNCGYERKSHHKVTNIKIKNTTPFINTTTFEKDDNVITIFYQPIIHSQSNKTTSGIELIRNNLISMNMDEDSIGGKYYLPDFILKMSNGENTNYAILDAKLSKQKTVRAIYVPILVYKYIFSLTPLKTGDKITGLYAINGKSDISNSDIISIYTDETPKKAVVPVKIITITEDTDDIKTNENNHFAILNDAGILNVSPINIDYE